MRTPFVSLLVGAYALLLRVAPGTLAASRTLDIKGDWLAGYVPQIDPSDTNVLRWVPVSSLGGGTVTSVALSTAADNVFTVTNPSTTPVIGLDAQAINTVFAGPATGAAGVPSFRALVASDLPIGTTAGTVAAGNDTRFHTRNTDDGFTQPWFSMAFGTAQQINLDTNGSTLTVRNNTSNNHISLSASGLLFNGNSNYNLYLDGTEVKLGATGSGYKVARLRKFTFTSANLTTGKLTVNHTLSEAYPVVTVYDNNGYQVIPDVRSVDANNLELDFGNVTITGTWNASVYG